MKATLFKILFFVLGAIGFSNVSYGNLLFGASGGYGVGSLDRASSESITAYPAQGFVGYSMGGFGFHGFFQHASLEYSVDDEVYTGVYSLFGVGVKLNGLGTEFGQFAIMAQVPLSGSYTVVSESKGTVQGFDYIYSTLTTLSGGSGFQGLVGYEFRSLGSVATKRGGTTYLGLYLSYLQQTFAKQSTRVKTNNSTLAPISPGAEEVSYSASLTSLLLAFTFEMR